MNTLNNFFTKRLIIVAIGVIGLIFSGSISANKGLEIAKLSDKNNEGFGDSSSSMTMELVSKKGDVVTRKLRFKRLEVPEDGDKSISVFESPRDVRGVAILSYAHKSKADDQWLYLPALKRVKRIASKNKSGPFLGSEFTFEDFSFAEVEKYDYTYIKEELIQGKEFFVIKRIPLDPYSGYTKQVVWIDKENYTIHKIHHFDRKSFHLKTQTFSDYKQYLGFFWQPHRVEMKNHQNGKGSILKFAEVSFNNGLTASDFSQSSLKRSR
jgi:outer membrane lipoprotein-sorting protein